MLFRSPRVDGSPVSALLDISFVHPGPYLDALHRRFGGLHNVEGPGAMRDSEKINKYADAAAARSSRYFNAGTLRTHAVSTFSPLSFSAHGRLYPSALKFLDVLSDLVSTRNSDPDMDGEQAAKARGVKYRLFRSLSSTIQRRTIDGRINAGS